MVESPPHEGDRAGGRENALDKRDRHCLFLFLLIENVSK